MKITSIYAERVNGTPKENGFIPESSAPDKRFEEDISKAEGKAAEQPKGKAEKSQAEKPAGLKKTDVVKEKASAIKKPGKANDKAVQIEDAQKTAVVKPETVEKAGVAVAEDVQAIVSPVDTDLAVVAELPVAVDLTAVAVLPAVADLVVATDLPVVTELPVADLSVADVPVAVAETGETNNDVQIIQNIADKLSVTPERVAEILDTLNASPLDLTERGTLRGFVRELYNAETNAQLLNVSNVTETFALINEALQEAAVVDGGTDGALLKAEVPVLSVEVKMAADVTDAH